MWISKTIFNNLDYFMSHKLKGHNDEISNDERIWNFSQFSKLSTTVPPSVFSNNRNHNRFLLGESFPESSEKDSNSIDS